jgi:hypothetical protein
MDGTTLFIILAVVVILAFTLLPALQNRLEERAERRSMEARGAVMRGATVTVHAVSVVDRPEDAGAGDDDEDPLPRTYYDIEVTIAPAAPGGRWSPFDVDIFDPEEDVEDEEEPGAEMALLYAVDVWRDGEWVPEEELGEGFTIDGEGRLVLLVGAHESVPRVGLIYFWEEFGEIELGQPGTASGSDRVDPER